MTVKRISALVFLLALAAMPVWMFYSGWPHSFPQLTREYIASGEFTAAAEMSFKNNFPLREQLSNLAWNLRYRTGTKELDGYFITGTGSVVKNVGAPNAELLEENNDTIRTFADQTGLPSAYLMLIPTACAVKQEDLPAFATLYNQKNFIESTYRNFSGSLTPINVYSMLLEHQREAIYFNTEELLTPLGGYYVYSAMGEKMNLPVRTLDQFSVEYPIHDYLGSLALRYPYAPLAPDIIALYHYDNGDGGFKGRSDYSVLHLSESGGVTYDTLYRREQLLGPAPLDVYLGGAEPIIRIRARNRPNTKLVVLGDSTAKSYIPFLALHYSELCFVDVTKTSPTLLDTLDFSEYDRALLAFSTDTYMHSSLNVLEAVFS